MLPQGAGILPKLVAAFLLVWLVAAVGMRPGYAQSDLVSGLNVRMVDFGTGAIVQVGPGKWGEVDKGTGQIVFLLDEVDRDEKGVRLHDAERDTEAVLSIATGEVLYGPAGSELKPIYDIVDVSDESRIRGIPTVWDALPPASLK